ncbi:MAG: pantetheine-phosphate adenylyltransferase [Clostridia bacterium]|nr:pantetheine-phosphate adenylyltransferase [Clostridia bacterium]MDD4571526.1 pantetheine-phosphate adenylyltransferase [Clostridia bacterium]
MRTAIYPGTFDPVTNGHLDIIERAARLFDKVIVAIADENYKNNLFNMEERLELMRKVTANIPNVEVKPFHGLLVNFCVEEKAGTVIRGLRAMSDFEREFQMALMNKEVLPEVETIFLMTASKYQFVSSSMIKNFASLDSIVTGLVPSVVEEALEKKYRHR